MSDVAKVLKTEIARISKREAKGATQRIAKSNAWLRKIVAELKRRVVLLEKENKHLLAAMKKYQEESPQKPDEETRKARITSKSIRSLRGRLGLSQAGFAKLVGVTTHTVFLWENKEGVLSLRDNTREALLSVRGMGAREAKQKLAEAETGSKAVKSFSSKMKRGKMRFGHGGR
jgi:DNA-binding transcriptional regulator YiaG